MSTLNFDVFWRDHGASAGMKNLGNDADKSAKRMQAFGATGAAAALAVGAAFVKFASDSVKAARESNKVTAQTQAVIKSTGQAANVTAKQVENLAGAISKKTGIDDEAIQSGENLLLTFTKVRNEAGKGNDVFNQGTQAITDMSVAMHQDMKSSAIQVGKALNDPIKGITALTRVGVTFTEAQKKQVAALEKSGHHLEAQKIILGELKKEFGGSAAAAATWADKAKVAAGNIQESFGKALLPSLEKASKWFVNHQGDVKGFTNNIADAAVEAGHLVSALDKLGKGPLDNLMHGKSGKKQGGGISEFGDEMVNLKQKFLVAADKIAGAWAMLGLLPKKTAEKIHQMRLDADADLGKLKRKFLDTKEAIQQKEIKAKVKADIHDLEAKIKNAKKRLKETNDQKTQASIKAEIHDLEAKVRAAKSALRSIPKTTNTYVQFHALGYGAVMAKVRAAKGAAMVRIKVPGSAYGGLVGHGVIHRAGGGGVPGYSPHSKADNIPAMLTAGEYVQPVSAVRKYGEGGMSAIREGRATVSYGSNSVGGGNTYILNAPNYVGSTNDLRRALVDMARRGELEVVRR